MDEDGKNPDNKESKLTLGSDGVHDISSGKYISLPMEVSLLILATLDSGSDYETTRKAAQKIQQQLERQGRDVSDTELEEEEDNLMLADDVEPGLDLSYDTPQLPSTLKQKGKGTQYSKAPGPVKREGLEAAQALGERTMEAAQHLAEKYSTSRWNILQMANLALKESWAPNPYNQHKEWYANHFLKHDKGMFLCRIAKIIIILLTHFFTQSETPQHYQEHCLTDYRLCTDNRTKMEKAAALKPIIDWCEQQDRTLSDNSDTSLKSLTTRMQAIIDKFSTLVFVTHFLR